MKQESIIFEQSQPCGIHMMALRQTGSRHRELAQECEDVIFTRETPMLQFYGLADGQSGARMAAAGGAACLSALEETIRDMGIGRLLNHPFPDELPCVLMKAVRYGILSQMKARGGDYQDYSSTLLALAVDPETGGYLLAHIGDGCAVSVGTDGSLTMISEPENGISSCHTWLTTSDNAVSHLRLRYGTLTGKKRIVLMTDGADRLCWGKNIPRQARALLTGSSQAEIISHLNASVPADDASCILLDLEPAKPTA